MAATNSYAQHNGAGAPFDAAGQQAPAPVSAVPHRSKRQYAANQDDAYYTGGGHGGAGSVDYGQAAGMPNQNQQQPQFFSPASGPAPQLQQQPLSQQGPYYQGGAPGQQPMPGPSPYMDASRMPYGGQQNMPPNMQQPAQYGQQPNGGMAGMNNQFGQMGVSSRCLYIGNDADTVLSSWQISVQTINLVQQPTDPSDLLAPLPELRLPPNVRH